MDATRGATTSWAELANGAPEHAEAGARLLELSAGTGVALLATVGRDGTPHVAPVCPILCDGALYLCAVARSPKRRDLAENGRYVLHALLGPDDEEFQVAGRAVEVTDPEEVRRVHAAIRFQFDPADPLFRLDVARCLWVHWERPGQPGTVAIRRPWHA